MIPPLASYDVIEISSSGGKDSLAMKSYIARLAKAAGVLRRVVVVHADLGRAEWDGTPELVAAQAAHFGFRFLKVRRPQGDLLDYARDLGKFPMPTQRWCTAMLKRGQIYRAFTELADELRTARALVGWASPPIRILNCIGLRAEESTPRARRKMVVRDPKASGNGTRKIVNMWLPVQHWKLAQIWAECRASGAPIHPAYARGYPRASCKICIFMNEAALLQAAIDHPVDFAEYVQVEEDTGHSFKHRLPLAKIAADVAAGVRPTGVIPDWTM